MNGEAPLLRNKPPTANMCPGYDTKQTDRNAGALGNAEHPFFAIAPRFPRARNGSTW